MTNEEAVKIVKEMLTGENQGRKPTIKELKEILAHRDIQLLPDGSITSIKLTKTEQEALRFLLTDNETLKADLYEKTEQEKLLTLYLENTREDLKTSKKEIDGLRKGNISLENQLIDIKDLKDQVDKELASLKKKLNRVTVEGISKILEKMAIEFHTKYIAQKLSSWIKEGK